ncbi:uncharacterized protein LOC144178264 isoform X2 [Haemaphysalis longicornis]
MRAPLYVVESQATVSSSSNVDVGASTTLARPQGAGTCTRPRLVFLYSALQNSQKIAHPVSSFGGQLLSQSSACALQRCCRVSFYCKNSVVYIAIRRLGERSQGPRLHNLSALHREASLWSCCCS